MTTEMSLKKVPNVHNGLAPLILGCKQNVEGFGENQFDHKNQ